MSRLDKIRSESEASAETLDPNAKLAQEASKASQTDIDNARAAAHAKEAENQRIADEAKTDLLEEKDNAPSITERRPPVKETLKDKPDVGEVQAVKRAVNERSYVLKAGKDLSVPIRFPNGQVVPVQFRDGHKMLKGRLGRLFHTEYLNNPNLRMKVAEVNQENADAVAKAYRANNPVAKVGNQEAGNSQLPARAMHDAQMREMQRRAAEGKSVTENVPGYSVPTANGDTLG